MNKCLWWQLKFVNRTTKTNEEQIIQAVEQDVEITYKYYEIALKNEQIDSVNTIEEAEELVNKVKEENKEQEHQRYERRKHIDDRELNDYIVRQKRVAENLEDYCINREQLKEIQKIVSTCTKTQQRRFYLNRICGYNYTEIARIEGCNLISVRESVLTVLKKLKNLKKI